MKTYRYGEWEDWDGDEIYLIQMKVWYGWKDVKSWNRTPKGKEEMEAAIKRLIEAGNTVI